MVNKCKTDVVSREQQNNLRSCRIPSIARVIQAWLLCGTFFCTNLHAESGPPTSLPLISIDHFTYVGAFRVPASTGSPVSSMSFTLGRIAYNPDRHSVFMTGHDHHQAIVEFAVPEIVSSTNVNELNMATVLQNFSTVLDKAPTSDSPRPDRINGMHYLKGPNGPELLVNATVFYTGSSVSDTTLVVRDPSNLAKSAVDGFFELQGRELGAGWISPVPSEWHEAIGGKYLVGHANNISIRSRLSVGPSAYVFDPYQIVGSASVPKPVPTEVLQVFPDTGGQRLHEDLYNASGQNNLWTELSRVHFGFIVPQTRTFFTVGRSGGHHPPAGYDGVCYKSQDSGAPCPPGVEYGGPGASDPEDYYHFFWLWDVNHMLEVKNGKSAPYQARPYARGVFPTPPQFQTSGYDRKIGGGSFDPESGLLFLTSVGADKQSEFDFTPIVLVYQVNRDESLGKIPMPPSDVRVAR